MTTDNPPSRKVLGDLLVELTPALDTLSTAVAQLGGSVVTAIEVDGQLVVRRSAHSRYAVTLRDPDVYGDDTEPRLLPREMTPAIHQVLGLMNFRTAPLAHLFRAAGADIEPRIEHEQAHVLFRLLHLALLHGDGWKQAADAEVEAARAAVAAKRDTGSAP